MILVTGGTGLLGSHLIKELHAEGKRVKALYRKNIPEDIRDKATWVQGDILDIILLEELMADVDQIYHCAALVTFNPRKKSALHKINVEGTSNVVNAALVTGVKKLLHVSSVSALGRKRNGQVVTEEAQWEEENNNSTYGRSKYFAELEVWRGVCEGLSAVIVNPTIILGAGNWNNGSASIFKNVYNEFPWYTNGISGFVDVADVVKAMIMLMDSDVSGERFILNAENWQYKELFTEMAKRFSKKPPHKFATPLLAGIVWRLEKLKSRILQTDPLVTKETAETAQLKVYFDNTKIQKFIPNFIYKPLSTTLDQYCGDYLKRMG